MEEEKNKFLGWVKNHATEIFSLGVTLAVIIIEEVRIGKIERKCGDLEKRNQEVEAENQELRGQVRANERENRRLSRELGDANYQLGKSVASKNK